MDEKEEDKSEESLRRHLLFYEKLTQKILDIQKEIEISEGEKVLQHLNERIKALELDRIRIRKLFPQINNEKWDTSD